MDFLVNLEIFFQRKFPLIPMEIVINMDMSNLRKEQMLKPVYNKKNMTSKDKKYRFVNLFLEIKENLE